MYYACGCSLEWKGHAGVRRGRCKLYVRLFMPCIFKMSQKSFNTFCVKDHQLVKSRLGICMWLLVGMERARRAQGSEEADTCNCLCLVYIQIWHRNKRP